MVHSELSKREGSKSRGRPFLKGNVKGKLGNAILDATGRESGNNRETIAPTPEELNQVYIKRPAEANGYIAVEVVYEGTPKEPESLPDEVKGATLTAGEGISLPQQQALLLVDAIEFTNGENKLKIVLLQKGTRLMQCKVLLNDTIEIKSATFVSKSMASTYFEMLRQHMKNR